MMSCRNPFMYLSGVVLLLLAMAIQAGVLLKTPLSQGTRASSPRALWLDDHPLFGLYDTDGFLVLSEPGSEHGSRRVSTHGRPEVVNSLIDLSRERDYVYLVWRPKVAQGEMQGQKHIQFSVSADRGRTFSIPRRLNSAGGAFHPLPLAQGGDGRLYLLWSDERSRPNGIYFNRSLDHGENWLEHELRMDGLGDLDKSQVKPQMGPDRFKPGAAAYDPFLLVKGQKLWIGWSESGVEPPYHLNRLKLKISDDSGHSWSEPVLLPTPGAQVFNPTLIRTDSAEISLFYWAQRKGIMQTVSLDDGVTWNPPSLINGTDVVGGQRFRTAQNSRGTICLAWEGPNRLNGRKADVFSTCSQDHGLTWPTFPTRLDSNTPSRSHSLAPSIAMDDAGNVFVAWRESRHIRPRIYANYSRDEGRTWLESDLSLEARQGVFQSTYPWVVSAGDGRFLVTWNRQLGDQADSGLRVAYSQFSLPGGKDAKQKPGFPMLLAESDSPLTPEMLAQREKRLVKRMTEYWEARKDNDYAKAFSLMDPFFRETSNLLQYGSPLSKMQYPEYEILLDQIRIEDSQARVKVRVAREAKTLQVKHIRTSVPRHDVIEDGTWVWVDGDWYKVYEIEGSSFVPL